MPARKKEFPTMTDALRETIAESGFSFNALERETGVLRQSLMKFVSGEQTLRLDMADRLAVFFGIHPVRQGATMNGRDGIAKTIAKLVNEEPETEETVRPHFRAVANDTAICWRRGIELFDGMAEAELAEFCDNVEKTWNVLGRSIYRPTGGGGFAITVIVDVGSNQQLIVRRLLRLASKACENVHRQHFG